MDKGLSKTSKQQNSSTEEFVPDAAYISCFFHALLMHFIILIENKTTIWTREINIKATATICNFLLIHVHRYAKDVTNQRYLFILKELRFSEMDIRYIYFSLCKWSCHFRHFMVFAVSNWHIFEFSGRGREREVSVCPWFAFFFAFQKDDLKLNLSKKKQTGIRLSKHQTMFLFS